MRAYERLFHREKRTPKKTALAFMRDIKSFLEGLPGRRVLDLGSGTGTFSALFQQYGFDPTCVDISERMVAETRKAGIPSFQMDFGSLGFPNEHFSGVWAHNSLMHAPKYRMPLLVYEAWRVLQPRGRFFVSLPEGEGEGWHVDDISMPSKRYIAYYTPDEFTSILQPNGFSLLRKSRVALQKGDALNCFLAERE